MSVFGLFRTCVRLFLRLSDCFWGGISYIWELFQTIILRNEGGMSLKTLRISLLFSPKSVLRDSSPLFL